MFNRTRQIYQQMLSGNKPSEEKIDEAITNAKDLKNLLKHPGWKVVESWMLTQKKGSSEYLEREVSSIAGLNFAFAVNLFLKYVYVLLENRGYNKVMTFIRVSIERGEEYAKQRK